MNTGNRKKNIERLTFTALLTALVAVLSMLGGFIKFGVTSINLTLVPVITGAALLGPGVGAWLGAVSGAVFFLTGDAAVWIGWSAVGTVITVMVKGIAAGFCSGAVYRLMRRLTARLKGGDIASTFVSAIVCPVVNTGLFVLGCLVFFRNTPLFAGVDGTSVTVGGFLIFTMVGVNFLAELAANVILAPAVCTLLRELEKNIKPSKAAKRGSFARAAEKPESESK